MQLEAVNLGKRFGKDWVLEGIDWNLKPSHIYSLTGLNGAGKTTLLSLLAGLYVGSQGAVLADGEPLRRESIEVRKRMMFLPDFPILNGGWTLYRHLAALVTLYGQEPDEAKDNFADLVKELDLGEVVKKPFSQMSRGQLYKSALLCMKVISPQYWLLDEPFASGADAHGISVMRRWFAEAKAAGCTVVFTTQMPEIAESSSDEIVLLEKHRCQFYQVQNKRVIGSDGLPFDLEAHMEAIRCDT